MLRLIYSIGGDNNPLKRALKETVKSAKEAGQLSGDAFSKEMGAQIKGALMGYIGFGAIKAAITKAVQDAQETIQQSLKTGASIEGTQEIQRIAKLTGMSPEEVQRGIASDPKGFQRLVSEMGKTGGVSDARTINQLGELGDVSGGLWTDLKSAIGEISTQLIAGTEGAFGRIWNTVGQVTGSDYFKQRGAMLWESGNSRWNKFYGTGNDSAPPTKAQIASDWQRTAAMEQWWAEAGGNDIQFRRKAPVGLSPVVFGPTPSLTSGAGAGGGNLGVSEAQRTAIATEQTASRIREMIVELREKL